MEPTLHPKNTDNVIVVKFFKRSDRQTPISTQLQLGNLYKMAVGSILQPAVLSAVPRWKCSGST